MRLSAPALLSIASVFFAIVGQAIFADEAYQTDYHHALLGLPQPHATFFHRPSPASKASLLYTLSERLVLGAVNPKDGAVIWRQQLADQTQNHTALGLLRAGEGGDTLVTAVGEIVNCWDATDGRLTWQWRGNGRIKSLEIIEGERDVLTLSEADHDVVVTKFAAETGAVLWQHKDARFVTGTVSGVSRVTPLTRHSGDLPYTVLTSSNRIFYVSLQSALLKGFKIKVTELSAGTGAPIGQPILLSSDSEVTSEDSILHVGANSGIPFLVWTDKALRTIRINIIGTKRIAQLNSPTSNKNQAEKITVHAPSSLAAKAHLLVHFQSPDAHWAEVYHVNSGTTVKAYDLPLLEGKGAFSATSQGSDVYFTRHTTFDNILLSSEDSTAINQWSSQAKSRGVHVDPQDITNVVSEVISKGASTYAVRSALTLLSGDWELIRNGGSLWVRPEGLTGVIAAAFVEIAKGESLAEELVAEVQGDPLSAYMHRVKRHIRDLQYFPAWAEALPKRLLGSFIGDKASSQDRSIKRDGFGFRKLVLVATEKGRLAALDVGDHGAVVWDIQAVNVKPGQKWEILSIEADDSTALLRGQNGEFLRVASITGAVLQYQPGGIIPSLKTTVPVIDTSGDKILIPVNIDGSLGEIPSARFANGTVIVTQSSNNVVRGWTLSKSSEPILSWSFIPAIGEHLTSVSARPPHDPVASIGKALGDRNVLYKYLNPNILLVTAIGPGTSAASFYVLDSTSGAVIYSTSHPGVDFGKPITSAISENWFAYSLFSESSAVTQGTSQLDRQKLKGYQLIVSELYESPSPNDRGSLGSSSNSSSIFPPSENMGDTLDIPHVVTQPFLIPGPISSMSVTSTLQGITTRSLLCVVPELKSIISVSRAFIDPRRPVGRDPTAAEAEEGLFRYSPMLDFEPKWMLSHKRDILDVSNVITNPSLLESTSLVFAYGELDLFGTRTAPIGAFDILGKGFSKLQLVLTVVALAVATTLVAPFVSQPSHSPCQIIC